MDKKIGGWVDGREEHKASGELSDIYLINYNFIFLLSESIEIPCFLYTVIYLYLEIPTHLTCFNTIFGTVSFLS